jgi:acyl-CoA dehydrogenase family protein 9
MLENSRKALKSAVGKARRKPSPTKPAAKVEAPSFAKALFHGHILSETVFPFPTPKPEERELLGMVRDSIRKLSKEIDSARIEDEKRIPSDTMQKLREMGFFGLIIPEEYGGFGFSNSTYVQIFGATTLLDPSITATVGAHQSIGMKALLMFGTPEQKERFLPRMATGEWIAAFRLTEPGAGSDARSLNTVAELSADGSHYVLNGSKIWITNGGIAHVFTVFARTYHTDAKGERKEKITCLLVTRDMEGFSSGPEEKKLGLLGSSTTSLHFENVKVPVENVIGEPGKGFKVAMAVLNNGRLGLAGACALGSKKLIQVAMEHAMQRRQFGKTLAEFGLIQSKLAGMAIDTFVAESMVRVTSDLMDRGGYDYSLETAMCKIFCTESEWRVVNEALQIAGGAGYMREYGYEKALRDSRIFTIWEGANEILRLFIGLAGLQGPGQELKEVAKALKRPLADVTRSLGLLSDYGVRWVQRRVSNPGPLKGVHPLFAKEAATFQKYTAYLATESERILLRYGKKIIENEFPVKRLADISTDLFAIACTLSHATSLIADKGEKDVAHEIAMTPAFCRKARRRMAENFRRLDKNDDELEAQISDGLCQRGGYPADGGPFSLV